MKPLDKKKLFWTSENIFIRFNKISSPSMFHANSTNTHVTSKLLSRDSSGLIMSGTLIRNSRWKHDTKITVFSNFIFCTFIKSAAWCSKNCTLPDISLSTKGPDITLEFSQVVWVKYWSRLGQSLKGRQQD